ncbi:inositol monophosphatase [Paenibacillus sp. N1-5-1-14]|uniref:inositol monophosphatase family protein n=1 Tax=Paenibacillus radicibacter TaxID=2972488 RepID=UPI00215926D8|nr:inositol monophosphatase family protein [Paenibacillus radicibacter]MCR8645013.1 inositol monophosphatase [Paenibacillus radicibacter]
MIENIIEQARILAIDAARAAGQIARERFGTTLSMEEKGQHGDLVTEVDHLAENVIVSRIRSSFPDHQIDSEEIGRDEQESDWLWLIDPLDGTNNYAIALPVFSVSISLAYQGQLVLAVVYEPMVDRMFVAERGKGATCNGVPMRVTKKDGTHRTTIGWIQGHNVQNEEEAVRLRNHIDISCKRMLRLWAPTLLWCMVAKGDMDGLVLYRSAGADLYSGILMVQEAGGAVVDFEGKPYTDMLDRPYLVACHPAQQESFIGLVKEGLDRKVHA